MDQVGKKLQCCGKLKMLLELYGQVAPGLKEMDLEALNNQADAAIGILAPAIDAAFLVFRDPHG